MRPISLGAAAAARPLSLSALVRALCAAGCFAAIAPAAQASCGSAFCSVNTDWTSDVLGLEPGSVLDLRYEYIPQKQPRTGTRNVGVGEIPAHHDEVHTINRNLLVNYSRNFGDGWGLAVQLPLVDRDHLHVHNHHGAQIPQQWEFRELGDMRLTGRYRRPWGDSERGPTSAGFDFGLKLPTGRTNIANSQGEVAERSLQPGTGTTDAILGAFFHQQLVKDSAAWFAQVQVQAAFAEHDGFAPGARVNADLGYSHSFTEKFSGQLQLNAVFKARDRGINAEPGDSGGQFLFVSPGVSYELAPQWHVYAFYQQPVYQHVNGVQLTAKGAVTVGLSTRF